MKEIECKDNKKDITIISKKTPLMMPLLNLFKLSDDRKIFAILLYFNEIVNIKYPSLTSLS